jgi:hypothetical protein
MSYRRYKNSDKSLVFAEYFNSEQEVRRNGGVPTDVSFDKGAAQFDGADSVIQYEGINVTSPFSFRCIATFDAAVDVSDVISQFDGSGGALLLYVSGQLRFYSSVGGSYANITTGTGRHEIVCTYDGTTSRIYANNVEGASVSGTTPPLSQRDTFLGMRYDTTNELEGSLEFVEIYNKALTAEEVSNLYNDARYVVPSLEHGEQLGDVQNVSNCENSVVAPYTSFANASSTGFTAISDGNGLQIAGTTEEFSVVSGELWRVTFDIEVHSGIAPESCRFVASLGSFLRSNTETPVEGHNSILFRITDTDTTAAFQWWHSSDAGNYTLSNLSIQKVTVEETSKILHVNAFDGVARNLLSGDVVGDDNIAIPLDIDTQFVGRYNAPTVTATRIIPTSTSSCGAYDTDSCVVGKKYKLIVKGICDVDTSWSIINDYGISPVIGVLSTGSFNEVFYFTAVNPELYFRINAPTRISNYIEFTELSLKEAIPEVVNTDVEVVKDGSVRVPRFNALSSLVNCGSYNDLTGDISLLMWYNINNSGGGGSGKLIDNGKFLIRQNANPINYWSISSDGGTTNANSGAAANYFNFNEWNLLAIVRNAAGIANVWINGFMYGPADQDSGTPVAPSGNLVIGGDVGQIKITDGEIAETIIIDGLLTPEEISQYYTATKHLYNK